MSETIDPERLQQIREHNACEHYGEGGGLCGYCLRELLATQDEALRRLQQENGAVERALADHGLGRQDGDLPKLVHRLADAMDEAEQERDALRAAIRDYLEWGPMTGSDRDLHERKFRKLVPTDSTEAP
jgi:hypothetical protein